MVVKEQTRNRVAIAGQVRDAETKLAIPGVLVEIANMPDSFKNWLNLHALQYGKSWQNMVKRLDRTITAIDGCFCFTNLPNGDYELSIYRANTVTRNITKEDANLYKPLGSCQLKLEVN